jgi:hypothetical protein
MPVMPNLSTLATASIAVWWAAVITAIVVVSERKTAPLAVVANPKPAPARAIALTHEPLPLSFGERFAAIEPTSAPPVPVVAEAAPADVSKLDKWNTALAPSMKPVNGASVDHRVLDRAEPQDRVCGHSGRHHFHDRPGHLSWRCRR